MTDDIFLAAENGDLKKLETLLDGDIGLAETFNDDGWSPLHLAALRDRVEAAEILLNRGADSSIRSRNSLRNTPLHLAVANGNVRLVKLLVDNGSDINASQEGGWTALHGAANIGDLELVEYLMTQGANPGAVSGDGLTPADIARERGFEEIEALLNKGNSG